jgi:hypothetical protein
MANTNSNLLQKLKETQVSTVTGTAVLAGAAICAFSVMPSPDSNFSNLLQASLGNISIVL